MDKSGLQLASRVAMSPNQLGYCGHDTAGDKFRKCIIEGICNGVEEELKHFIVLNPYLQTLAKILGKKPTSRQVVEAYWLGNELLNLVRDSDYEILLNNFSVQGVPQWLINDLKNKPPKKFIPTHLFQVLHVGVGRASGSVPYNLETINNCMVRWGTAKAIFNLKFEIFKQVEVELNS